MRRQFITATLIISFSAPVFAEVWMIKASTLGCRERETLVALDAAEASTVGASPEDCVVLDAGERLLDQPGIGRGFDDYVKLVRRDNSAVFVRSRDIVRDPGIGSVYEDRMGE